MNQQEVQYKICLFGHGNDLEIRCFTIDKLVYNYHILIQKILVIFPGLKDVPFAIYWKDKEGDSVRICTNDELVIALNEMKSDNFKKIFVKRMRQENGEILHEGVICDGCYNPIQGFRYKCLICSDYDLCSDCERLQVHSDHPAIRIPKPLNKEMPLGKRFSKEMHKISKHLERLFQTTSNPCDNRSAQNEKKKKLIKFCPYSEAHNLISNLLYEKIVGLSAANANSSITQQRPQQCKHSIDPQPSLSTNNGIDVNATHQSGSNSQVNHEPLQNACGEEPKPIMMHEDLMRISAANTMMSVPAQQAPLSEILPLVSLAPVRTSTAATDAQSVVFEIDAPVPADPTPVLRAQLTLPVVERIPCPVTTTVKPLSNFTLPIPVTAPSSNFTLPIAVTTPSSNPTLLVTDQYMDLVPTSNPFSSSNDPDANIHTSLIPDISNEETHPQQMVDLLIPPPKEDVSCLDNSWAVVDSGMSESFYSLTSSLVHDKHAQDEHNAEKIYPQLSAELQDSEIHDAVEKTLTKLKLLGFEDKEWLRLVVEEKKGNIKEVLRFLSPTLFFD